MATFFCLQLYGDIEKEALKRNILQKHEALEILSKIAKGTAKKVNEQIIIPIRQSKEGLSRQWQR